MDKIRVILEGGFKSCCNVYSAEQLKVFTVSWFDKYPEIDFDIIELETTQWDSEVLADFAYKQLKAEAFPLIYCNDKLVAINHFPERDDVFDYIKNPKPLNEQDILNKVNELKEIKQ